MLTEFIAYDDEGYPLEAFVAMPSKEKRPLVILCHAWKGRDDVICEKAKELARLGYSAFALDMYGKGVLGGSKEENAALKKPFVDDRSFLRRRVLKGFEAACNYGDTDQIAVLGYGFGGLCALDLARTGVNLRAAVSVYGHFKSVPSESIKAKILAIHGHDDQVVLQEELRSFEKEMSEQNVDWQVHILGGAKHAFANPEANDPKSAKRAWDLTLLFLNEIFNDLS